MLTGNYLIDGLDEPAREALKALLRPAAVSAGDVLIEQGERARQIHFPTTAYLVNRLSNRHGQTLQVTFIGREGVSGLAPFLADAPCSWAVMAQSDGKAFVGDAREVRLLAEATPSFMRRLHQLTHFYQAEAHHLAIAATYHPITARLASWLLTAFQLSPTAQVVITQDEVAHHLGVQRTSIVAAYQTLIDAKAVRLMRGRITLLNEEALRQVSCGTADLIQELAVDLGILPRPLASGAVA